MIGKVQVLDPGFFSTIQDEGRVGFRKYGVPCSGAMDQKSFELANLLLGNNTGNTSVIEWVVKPPVLHFNKPTSICVTGADIDVFINDNKVKMNYQIPVQSNDVLCFGKCRNKMYGYVGISNGFSTDLVLNSRSLYNGITKQDRLQKGDILDYKSHRNSKKHWATLKVNLGISNHVVKVFKGPEFDLLTSSQKDDLFQKNFRVSQIRNRMAIQLDGVFKNELPTILTAPVLPGTVQLTPSGTIIILMRDAQTTGGYPRILQLAASSIDTIAQKRSGEELQFNLIDF